jgi:hypothetical protein
MAIIKDGFIIVFIEDKPSKYFTLGDCLTIASKLGYKSGWVGIYGENFNDYKFIEKSEGRYYPYPENFVKIQSQSE